VKTARESAAEPVSEEETSAAFRVRGASCGPYAGLFFPGVSQFCLGQNGKGAALLALGATELGVGVGLGLAIDGEGDSGFAHPGAAIPLLAFQDTYSYSLADGFIQRHLAEASLFAPRDSLADLIAAPFNWEVMKRPRVWAGVLGTLALGIGVSLAITGTGSGGSDRPNVFGRRFSGGVGYPLAGAVGTALFSHVAIGEETLFRGVLQSQFARRRGEWAGWGTATVLFGLVHAPNAFALEPEDRTEFLLYGLPVITAVGAYFGWVYKAEGYSLAPPVALHFWYDLLLSATFFALDPSDSPISASFSIPF